MENFKIWIISICGAGIITSIFRIIISNSNLKKSINTFLSMFVFLYTILPIENFTSDFNLEFNNYETSSYSDIYKNGYETIIIKSIETVCNNHGVNIISINIDSYIDENYYLVVNKIEIRLSSDDKNKIIKNELYEKFNYEVIFI